VKISVKVVQSPNWRSCLGNRHGVAESDGIVIYFDRKHENSSFCACVHGGYYNLPNTQLNRLQHTPILLHVPSSGPQSSHINTALKSLHWLKIKQRIDCKILSLTYKVLTTTQPSYLYNLISVQPHRSTRSSDIITLSRPPSSSSVKVNNRSFRHASPCLWNQLPKKAVQVGQNQSRITGAMSEGLQVAVIANATCSSYWTCSTTVIWN